MPVWRRFFSVFPTGVGVIPSLKSSPEATEGIPHGCGGDPSCLQQEDPSARILYNGPSIRAMRS